MQVIDYDIFIAKCNIIIGSCHENKSAKNPISDYLRGREEGIQQLCRFITNEVQELTDLMNDYGQQEHEARLETYD